MSELPARRIDDRQARSEFAFATEVVCDASQVLARRAQLLLELFDIRHPGESK
jgi:hypothetical protein